ncbi:tetratricopeptide repeat protein [Sapientia aquatica]|uniref:Tetratricopeptide repeat protein n=1 Tax=Sapientia aquatica TaxID=1549640 RepID=A0A4R5VTD3_9BURK|nr:tetratricopeptide repeat protein [Sapientia aquatica]TDK61957.1 tetratricopeptide repeat protein [Sapientia aquatica]
MDNQNSFYEEALPILTLIQTTILSHPRWSLSLLEATTNQLVTNLRQQRIDSDDDLKTVEEVCQDVFYRHVDEANLFFRIAEKYAVERQLEQSLIWISRAIGIKETECEFHRFRADVLTRLGRLEEAETSLQNALKISPLDISIQHELSQLKTQILEQLRRERNASSNVLAAISKGKEVLSRSQDSSDYAELAHLLANDNQLAEALKYINLAIAQDPNQSEHLRLQASLFARQESFYEAENAINQAINLSPTNPDLHQDKFNIEQKIIAQLKIDRTCVTDLTQAILIESTLAQRCPDDAQTNYNVAYLLTEGRIIDSSLEYIERAIALDASQAEFHRLRALVLEHKGRLARA